MPSSDVLAVVLLGPDGRSSLLERGFALARRAADRSGSAWSAALVGGAGEGAERVARAASLAGARRVLLLNDPELAPYTAESASRALGALLRRWPCRLVTSLTSGATRETFARLAVRLGAPYGADVLAVDEVRDREVRVRRAVWAGSVLVRVVLRGEIALLTGRPACFAVPRAVPAPGEPALEPVALPGALRAERKRVIALHPAASGGPDLAGARTIVAVGRGIGGPEPGVRRAARLAELLGGVLGATRAVVDSGWLGPERQIGQTGRVVSPRLYLALGVSGAVQHLAGMRNSECVVAIDIDRCAPIFEVADYRLVADLRDALPRMIRCLEGAPDAARGGEETS